MYLQDGKKFPGKLATREVDHRKIVQQLNDLIVENEKLKRIIANQALELLTKANIAKRYT